MAPVVAALRARRDFQPVVVVTAQHREMLDQVLSVFRITPDRDLDIMLPEQSLTDIVTRALRGLWKVVDELRPAMVLVQGDAATCFVGAVAAYYHRIPIGHVEAGLRTDDKYQPFPEEMNRRMTSVLADLHFAPTAQARQNLLREGVAAEGIVVTGNTVIDALQGVGERGVPAARAPPPFPPPMRGRQDEATAVQRWDPGRQRGGGALRDRLQRVDHRGPRDDDTLRGPALAQ